MLWFSGQLNGNNFTAIVPGHLDNNAGYCFYTLFPRYSIIPARSGGREVILAHTSRRLAGRFTGDLLAEIFFNKENDLKGINKLR
ncbi:hypothetical protein J6590_001544 [Homalodisca vitripennis]|nr:hypothetical protein J6590_001544 [Homalodisca vitripennis]